MTTASPALSGQAIVDTDLLRAQQYGFLSLVLGAAPDAGLLGRIAAMSGEPTALGQAYGALAVTAARFTQVAVEREYFEVFIGVGRGEILPYGSFYLTGFLNERPLADLRADLARLGVTRVAGRHEPEDHIASVLEVMAGMAMGRFAAHGLAESDFFARHVAPWAGQFFDDLAMAPSADFYRPIAEIGRIFVDIEARAFALGGGRRGN